MVGSCGPRIAPSPEAPFATITEVGAKLKYQLTNRLHLTAGYTLIAWANVARPGEQIDRFVDEGLLPFPGPDDPPPSTNPLRPRFVFADSSLLLHGINLGAELIW